MNTEKVAGVMAGATGASLARPDEVEPRKPAGHDRFRVRQNVQAHRCAPEADGPLHHAEVPGEPGDIDPAVAVAVTRKVTIVARRFPVPVAAPANFGRA